MITSIWLIFSVTTFGHCRIFFEIVTHAYLQNMKMFSYKRNTWGKEHDFRTIDPGVCDVIKLNESHDWVGDDDDFCIVKIDEHLIKVLGISLDEVNDSLYKNAPHRLRRVYQRNLSETVKLRDWKFWEGKEIRVCKDPFWSEGLQIHLFSWKAYWDISDGFLFLNLKWQSSSSTCAPMNYRMEQFSAYSALFSWQCHTRA